MIRVRVRVRVRVVRKGIISDWVRVVLRQAFTRVQGWSATRMPIPEICSRSCLPYGMCEDGDCDWKHGRKGARGW